jgi:hypothetical protein
MKPFSSKPMLAPANTPPEVLGRLNAEIQRASGVKAQ